MQQPQYTKYSQEAVEKRFHEDFDRHHTATPQILECFLIEKPDIPQPMWAINYIAGTWHTVVYEEKEDLHGKTHLLQPGCPIPYTGGIA